MGKRIIGLSDELIIHPGETLKEILEDRQMTQRELSVRTDVTEAHVSKIIRGQKGISVNYAKKLEYALSIDASFWINLQCNYEKELADFEEINHISSKEIQIYKELNEIIEYMISKDLLIFHEKVQMGIIDIRKLLNISNLDNINMIPWLGACRLAMDSTINPNVLFAWIRMCDLLNGNQTINNPLDLEKLLSLIPNIKKIMFYDEKDIEYELKRILSLCGIKFLIVKHFKGAPVQGFIKVNQDESLSLTLTNRRKYADIFWFTFFHELAHIIKGHVYKELVDFEEIRNQEEDEADDFASNLLIEQNNYLKFINKNNFQIEKIEEFAKANAIPLFIVIGRLQKDGIIKYTTYSEYKHKYNFY